MQNVHDKFLHYLSYMKHASLEKGTLWLAEYVAQNALYVIQH